MSLIRRKHINKRKGLLKKFVILSAISALFVIFFMVGVTLAIVSSDGKDIPDIDKMIPKPIALTTRVYSHNGKLITTFHGEENREYTKLKDIPLDLQNAIIAIEDERFFKHKGIDYQGIIRALIVDIKNGKIVEGGSTITQQLVKNRYLSHEKTITRKVKEAMLAWQIERRLSKKQILEAYLNTIYFGEGTYGVVTAANKYFKKPLKSLSISESATLAGIIRSPVNYSPFRNKKEAVKRKKMVIKRMYIQKMIDKKSARRAMDENLKLAIKPKDGYKTAPYFIEYVKHELIKKYGVNMVFKGGLKVYTTLDESMQNAAEKAVESTLDRENDPSASLVAIDPKTGYIKAMVGGRDFTKQKFNLAAQGKRQAGSAFKIFVLSAAIAKGFSLNDVFTSAPKSFYLKGWSRPWNVQNYGNKYRGSINLASATAWSDNSVFSQLIMKVTPKKVVEMAKLLGIKSNIPAVPAIALGGLTTGVSALEMASSAATLANDGQYNNATAIKKVLDRNNALIDESKVKPIRKISSNVARVVTSALMGVMKNGTGTRAQIGRQAAGKTGTAQDYRDAWFVGYTPNLASAVWMGYAHAQVAMTNIHGMRIAGGTLPAEIWKKFMSEALKNLKAENFNNVPKSTITKGKSYGSGDGYSITENQGETEEETETQNSDSKQGVKRRSKAATRNQGSQTKRDNPPSQNQPPAPNPEPQPEPDPPAPPPEQPAPEPPPEP